MARPKLSNSEQSKPLRIALKAYEFAASLKLAVVLIFSVAFTLAYATFIEAAYGTPVVQFFVYKTWWFNLINFLLALNIFCAAAIRYPWERHQTGFVITHIGLLILLSGAMVGRSNGIDAQIPIYEGQDSRYAFDYDHLKFQLEIADSHDPADGGTTRTIPIPFRSGPFNWESYTDISQSLSTNEIQEPIDKWLIRKSTDWIFPLANRNKPGDVLFDQDGVKLEILDFVNHSMPTRVPFARVMLSVPSQAARPQMGPDGLPVQPDPEDITYRPVSLEVNNARDTEKYPYGIGMEQVVGGGKMSLSLSGSTEQDQAFQRCIPEGTIGESGQVSLLYKSQVYRFDVSTVISNGNSAALGENLNARVIQYVPSVDPSDPTAQPNSTGPVLIFQLEDDNGDAIGSALTLFANRPEVNEVDHENKIFGYYWFDFSELQLQQLQAFGGSSRIELLQTSGHKLIYRIWNRRKLAIEDTDQGELTLGKENSANAFKMPIAQLTMYLDEFISSDELGVKYVPQDFERDTPLSEGTAAHVRMTVSADGGETVVEEFWLQVFAGDPGDQPARSQLFHKDIAGKHFTLKLEPKTIDIGFRIRLKDFERKLDPGTSQASHYSSWVDFIDVGVERNIWHTKTSGGVASAMELKAFNPEQGLNEPADNEIQDAHGLTINSQWNRLYWVDNANNRIQTSAIDSPSVETIEFTSARGGDTSQGQSPLRPRNPQAVTVGEEYLYWADSLSGGRSGTVTLLMRSESDGSNTSSIATIQGRLDKLILDRSTGTLYWTNQLTGVIGSIKIDGTEMNPKAVSGVNTPRAIMIDEDQQILYWSASKRKSGSTMYEGVIRSALVSELPLEPTDNAPTPGKQVTSLGEEQFAVSMVLSPTDEKMLWIQAEIHPQGYIGHHSRIPYHSHHLILANVDGTDSEDLRVAGIDLADSLVLDEKGNQLFWSQSSSFRHDVYITMNAPVQFDSPTNGQSYRLFQESFNGPFKPGDPEYSTFVPKMSRKADLYRSVLTVNRDPGRAIKYLGCLIVVLGISIMFYMRAYFFKSTEKTSPTNKSTIVVEPVEQTKKQADNQK